MWSVLSALYPVTDHTYWTQDYEAHINSLDFTGLEFPIKLQDIAKFEKINKDISINVFGLTENYQVYPLVITNEEKDKHIDLIYLTLKRLLTMLGSKIYAVLFRGNIRNRRASFLSVAVAYNFFIHKPFSISIS
ncbi:hypothetical protein JTE90_029011 [Oedothorax gibbosus]|uniref:Uncharacterized protein n=1 Tax=Oedothorax gibbosus TaxID=931172 RepID=A0AAV6VHM4_9ARAC|nr:hypothetical protein JTE90_029011 [Oedothorax gibbosus]